MYKPTPYFLGALAALFIFGLLFVGVTRADTATVSATPATTRTDGTTLTAAELVALRFQRGTCSGTAFGSPVDEIVVPAPGTSAVFPTVSFGTHCFRAFQRATDRDGSSPFLESVASNVVVKIVQDVPPNPPVLSSTVTLAYQPNGSQMRAVAIIPLGTLCFAEQTVVSRGVTYYMIDRGDVTRWARQPKPGPIYSRCA